MLLLPHFIIQSKLQSQPRIKGRETKLWLVIAEASTSWHTVFPLTSLTFQPSAFLLSKEIFKLYLLTEWKLTLYSLTKFSVAPNLVQGSLQMFARLVGSDVVMPVRGWNLQWMSWELATISDTLSKNLRNLTFFLNVGIHLLNDKNSHKFSDKICYSH
jgi:hypothetical protein